MESRQDVKIIPVFYSNEPAEKPKDTEEIKKTWSDINRRIRKEVFLFLFQCVLILRCKCY